MTQRRAVNPAALFSAAPTADDDDLLGFSHDDVFFHQQLCSLTYNDDDRALHDLSADSTRTSLAIARVRHSVTANCREVNMTYHFTYMKSSPRFLYTLATYARCGGIFNIHLTANPAFSVASIESPRYGGPLL